MRQSLCIFCESFSVIGKVATRIESDEFSGLFE